jgi:AcrR family transcriptional regulator
MKKQGTKELIKQKAKALFFSYGPKSVSIDDIAKETAVSKKTIYQFFHDKNAIVSAVVTDLVQSHHQLFETVHSTSQNAIDEVLKQDSGLSLICQGIRPSFLLETENSFPAAWESLQQYKVTVHKYILDNLLRGKNEGLYRETFDGNVISELRLQQLVNLLNPGVLSTQNLTAKQLANEFTILFLSAITTEKGKQLLDEYLES